MVFTVATSPCPGCGVENNSLLCQHCLDSLVCPTHPLCFGCGRRLWPSPIASTDALCPRCSESPPQFEDCLAPFLYANPLASAVQALKYRRQFRWAFQAALLLTTRTQKPNIQLLIPIPLHPWKLMLRGYNQAGLIAMAVGQIWDVPVSHSVLRRRWTWSQVHRSGRSRRHNLRGAFQVRATERDAVADARIGLVDDIVTTGTTLNEASSALMKGGATSVVGICLARAL